MMATPASSSCSAAWVLRFCRLALAAHFLGGYGAAAVYYVAPDGKDSNKGSPRAPFRTLSRGAQAARAGDTVIVRDGAYDHESAVTGGDGDRKSTRLNSSHVSISYAV